MSRTVKLLVLGWLGLFFSTPLWASVTWQGHCRDRLPFLYYEEGQCKGPGGVPKRSANYQYIDQLEAILLEMRRSGEVTRIYESYGLEAPIQQE